MEKTENSGSSPSPRGPSLQDLKALLLKQDPSFWKKLPEVTLSTETFTDVLMLSNLRKKALQKGLPWSSSSKRKKIRLAVVGAYSLYPLHELLEHFLWSAQIDCELFLGEYDNYTSEILDEDSGLYSFKPEIVFVLPSERRCHYSGGLTDSHENPRQQASSLARQTLDLCQTLHRRISAEIVLSNFILPGRHDLGSFRARCLGSDWSFKKLVNLELGLAAPSFVHICDLEFLGNRRGAVFSRDDRAWFESKQLGSPDFLVDVAKEASHIIRSLHQSPKKVLVLDLDNTLWGGVIGDDGLEGIEIGDTSPRGEAFKLFQKYISTLPERGVLLGVCSKNDPAVALQPFEKHPEMVLKANQFVSFKANWKPKSDNLREMAKELELGLDSFVFVDDNPAEIEIVRQFAPEVSTILLSPDPSEYVAQLQDCRFFEPKAITQEDAERTQQYLQEAKRRVFSESFTDMGAYLKSLEMVGSIQEFVPIDAPRVAQLINKSNQFNLTTRRRTEAEVGALMLDPSYAHFTVRLSDKFGDHGLISVMIGKVSGSVFEIDTLLMSCRVLKRQVEEEIFNEIVRLARLRNCSKILGVYLPTAKNGMVRDLYPKIGFQPVSESPDRLEFECNLLGYRTQPTHIRLIKRAYESN